MVDVEMNVVATNKESSMAEMQPEQACQKPKIDHDEYARILADFDFTLEEQHRIIRKVDRRVVVTLGVLFCVSLIDRVNLGSANIAGMGQDLQLVGDRYVSLPLLITSCYVKTTALSGADCQHGGF